MADYVDDRGGYEGLDVSRKAISICNEWIAPKLDRFNFQRVDVHNSYYNPKTDAEAYGYRFPFDDASIDFQFSNSLFTHMLASDTEHYFSEISRVLKPGGIALNTMFLLNDESVPRIDAHESGFKLPHVLEDGLVRVEELDRPEAVVAYDEGYMRDIHAKVGLGIQEPIRYGVWSGRPAPTGPGFGNKDIVVAVRG